MINPQKKLITTLVWKWYAVNSSCVLNTNTKPKRLKVIEEIEIEIIQHISSELVTEVELDRSGTGTRARLGCGSGLGVCSGARIYACRFSHVKTRGRDSGACAWTTSPCAHAEGAIRNWTRHRTVEDCYCFLSVS